MSEQLEGINSVLEALRVGRAIKKIYVDKARQDQRIDTILSLAARKRVPVERVDRARLNSLSQYGRCQGVLARVSPYRYYEVEEMLEEAFIRKEEPFLIILDGLEDPQNLGSIIRTAECAGVHGVIIPRHGAARITPAVARASAGAIEHVKVAQVTNLVNTIESLKRAGVWVVGTDPAAQQDYFEIAIPTPVALVIGGEGRGVRRRVKEHCDLVVKIPMYGSLGSLNAAISCALVAYEVVRQRRAGKPV